LDKLSDTQMAWIRSGPVLPETITVVVSNASSNDSATYRVLDRDANGRVKDVGSRCGFKGFVLRVLHEPTSIVYAAKLAVPGDYKQRSESQEATLASKLRGAGALFVCPTMIGRCKPPEGMPDATEDFVCFITPWVDGDTLHSRLRRDGAIEASFVCTVSLEILRAISYLKNAGLKHDDLHAGNVMISQVDKGLALLPGEDKRLQLSIIDMGSLKPVDQSTSKSRNDWLCFVDILVELYNKLHSNRREASTYPGFMRRFGEFIEKITDEDTSRFFPSDSAIAGELDRLRRDLDSSDDGGGKNFQPFEAISAEHLADDATLLALFVGTLPWMADVQESKPIVLTGPRGCGKSMIFRYLAVRTHLGTEQRAADGKRNPPFNSFGVYVSCATHLQNNLSWIARKEGRALQRAQEISTYFQLVIARELLKALGLAQEDAVANRTFKLAESGFDELIAFMSRYFSIPVETPRLSARRRILHFAEDLDAARVRLHMRLLQEEAAEFLLPDTFLGDVTQGLGTIFPYFKHHQVVFMLDDYSSNRVQLDIQQILNKIVFERLPSHFFKISCEKYGFEPVDIDGARVDETREFSRIDAGRKALSATDVEAREFVTNLIDRRLRTAKWKGTAKQLIGSSDPYADDKALAVFIRTEGSNVGRRYYYYGLEALGRLWSGDTATILQIVREMFTLGQVQATTTSTISKPRQHDAITSISKAFKERVEGYHPYGSFMNVLLGAYGALARDVLVEGRLNRKGIPYRLYRLEMTKPEPRSTIALLQDGGGDEDAALAKELLRRAVFIELDDSRGKEGVSSQTMRWEMRRIFNPAFGLSLKRDSYLDIKQLNDLRKLLTDPKAFAHTVREKYSASKGSDRHTGTLFDGPHDE
jgi:hypothetical protein